MTDKVAFILPGYGFNAEDERYTEAGEMFSRKGVTPEYVEIEWVHELSENIAQAEKVIRNKLQEYEGSEVYLFGHSWGAVCALMVSPDIEPEAQVLASLSPSFEEDVEQIPGYQIKLTNIRTALFRNLGIIDYPLQSDYENPSLEDLKTGNLGDLYFLYAESEYHGVMSWGNKVSGKRKNMFPDSREVVISGATHQMNSESYLEDIERIIEEVVE